MTKLDLSITERIDYETFVRIISNIPSCIFFKDTDLKYRFSSHCWAQLINDDIIGKTDADIRKDTENALKAMEADQAIIDSKKGCSYVIESVIDGETSYLELIKEPIMDKNGEVIGIVGLINDVTANTIMEKKIVGMSEMLTVKCTELETSNEELKATLEKVESMHASQKLFTASMNHELRSPLNGIIGNLQLLMDDDTLNSEQLSIIKNAYSSSQLMLDIVNDLLDFAKLEMSNFTIRNDVFELSTLIRNVRDAFTPQAFAKNLGFEVINNCTAEKYFGDATRIMQIMHNFVSNAIKYTSEGKVTLTISYESGNLVLSCADTGQGISEESQKSLFDPFVRLNERQNIGIQGTGLGLSVVKRIIENLNGEVIVDSVVNEGSTFTAKIPVELAKDKTAPSSSDMPLDIDYLNVNFDGLKVLCIDDSSVNVTFMVALLKKNGMVADAAYSPEEGISKATENQYDIIFVDHMMPGMDGIQVFNHIRDNCPLNAETPIVMLTGNADLGFQDFYQSQGLDGYLVKPVVKGHLLDMIASVTGV